MTFKDKDIGWQSLSMLYTVHEFKVTLIMTFKDKDIDSMFLSILYTVHEFKETLII